MASLMDTVLSNLSTLIANTSYWQTMTGTSSVASAKTFIFDKFVHREADLPTPPYIELVPVDGSLRHEEVATHTYIRAGEIDVLVTNSLSSGSQSDGQKAADEVRLQYYDLLDAIQAQSGQANSDGTRMAITAAEQEGPTLIQAPEQSNNQIAYEAWQGVIRVSWGHRGGA